ncbi:hypothetical protein Dsin_005977 [Dipteronia sinensis]|uniref:Signal recognition particle 19 kDa protein n=1 Tax=Dipteronia sinensis TaxID=43782 RepID=A0AAE0AYD0_9ROSI|nr:hypothetical protein Dsin_005977 [Dipteronia sinensis]
MKSAANTLIAANQLLSLPPPPRRASPLLRPLFAASHDWHQIFVLIGEMMDGEMMNIKKWIVLYPVYINSKKMIVEGRRISTSKACEKPTCAEIGDCCSHLKIPFAIEIDKAYPRDFMQRGRVRALLKRETGLCSIRPFLLVSIAFLLLLLLLLLVSWFDNFDFIFALLI